MQKNIENYIKVKNNKYLKWYKNIITNAKYKNRVKGEEYYESHHVIPKSLRKDLEKETNNLVLLTAREHFICHLLLPKFTFDEDMYKMLKAFEGMLNWKTKKQNRYVTSHIFEITRKTASIEHSKRMKGSNNYMYGKTHTKEVRKIISNANKGKIISENHKKAISKKISGKNNGFFGKTHSKKFKEEQSKRMMGKNNPMFGKPAPNRGIPHSKKFKEEHSKRMMGKNNPMFGNHSSPIYDLLTGKGKRVDNKNEKYHIGVSGLLSKYKIILTKEECNIRFEYLQKIEKEGKNIGFFRRKYDNNLIKQKGLK